MHLEFVLIMAQFVAQDSLTEIIKVLKAELFSKTAFDDSTST